jgi:hypothetical protein
MNGIRAKVTHRAQLALWVWRPWATAKVDSQQLRLLERRVAAARFGINSPPRFLGTSVSRPRLELREVRIP